MQGAVNRQALAESPPPGSSPTSRSPMMAASPPHSEEAKSPSPLSLPPSPSPFSSPTSSPRAPSPTASHPHSPEVPSPGSREYTPLGGQDAHNDDRSSSVELRKRKSFPPTSPSLSKKARLSSSPGGEGGAETSPAGSQHAHRTLTEDTEAGGDDLAPMDVDEYGTHA